MHRVIANRVTDSHNVDEGLHPSGRVVSLPQRTPKRLGTEKTLGK